MNDDPERVLADALRAQATTTNAGIVPQPVSGRPAMAVGWVLFLALLLGLAAGTVAAVITLR